jgi:hypothetical protein
MSNGTVTGNSLLGTDDVEDAGYRPQVPPLNADRVTVFDYRIRLLLYLWAISIFPAVGRALDPQFLTTRRSDLIQARDSVLARGHQLLV